jgi:hypothetical protein
MATFANPYRECKNKYKIKVDDSMYARYIEDVTSTMFDWDERIFRPELFDRMIRDSGMAALIKTDVADYTPVWFTPVDLGNGWYPDGWFKDAKCFDFMGKEYTFKDWLTNPDILVFFNNFMRAPDLFVDKYATFLSDVDFSILNNVHFSRQHPIPIARDKQTLERIKQASKLISEGQFDAVLMETNLKDILDGKEMDVLNITDVEKSQYIQYLSHLHDSLISRLFFMLGLGTTDNGKQAQISVDELNKNDDASITQALAWYNERKKAVDAAKEKGHDLSFDFSPLWKARIESIINPPEVESTTDEEPAEEEKEVEEDGTSEDAGNSDE